MSAGFEEFTRAATRGSTRGANSELSVVVTGPVPRTRPGRLFGFPPSPVGATPVLDSGLRATCEGLTPNPG